MNNIHEIVKLEKRIAKWIEELKEEIVHATNQTSMDGVKPIKPNVCTVNFGSLDKTILSPDYYLQSAQSKLVAQKLSGAHTCTQVIERVWEMIETGKVRIGSNTERLNPCTINILKSYLNKWNLEVVNEPV